MGDFLRSDRSAADELRRCPSFLSRMGIGLFKSRVVPWRELSLRHVGTCMYAKESTYVSEASAHLGGYTKVPR